MVPVSVAGAVAGMAVPGRCGNDYPAGVGARNRARPSRPISGQVSSGPKPNCRIAQSAAAATAFSASASGDPTGRQGGPGE